MQLHHHKLKPLVHALGATKLNEHRYSRAYKQIIARMSLLLQIQYHHKKNDTLTAERLEIIESHTNSIEYYYELLDINNTIDHTPKWLPNWNHYMVTFPARKLRQILDMPDKPKAFQDDATKELLKMQNASRKAYAVQRIHKAMEEAHNDGWYIIFDTLTLADYKIEKFYANKNCLRDYTRDIGRMILKAENRPLTDSYTDCYQYVMVPEYGTKNGRLHFHIVHLMRTLPRGTTDPNFGRPSNDRHHQTINTLQHTWKYGMTLPLAVRYQADAFTRDGWLWPLDRKTRLPLESKPLLAVGHYVSKYINKASDQDLTKKGLGGLDKWNKTLQDKLKATPTHLFRIRMSRGFGMTTPSMAKVSNKTLIQLTQLHWSVTPYNKILKENAKKELKQRLSKLTLRESRVLLPETTNLLKSLRDSMKATLVCNPASFTVTLIPKLTLTGISNETRSFLHEHEFLRDKSKIRPSFTFGSK